MPPQIDLSVEKSVQDACRESIQAGIILSAHDCADGGLAVTLAECCITGKRGAKVKINNTNIRNDALLFGETQSRIVISFPEKNLDSLKEICNKYEAPIQILGKIKGNNLGIGNLIDIEVKQLKKAWERDIN